VHVPIDDVKQNVDVDPVRLGVEAFNRDTVENPCLRRVRRTEGEAAIVIDRKALGDSELGNKPGLARKWLREQRREDGPRIGVQGTEGIQRAQSL
jgi:hypothetical protein